MPLNKHKDLKGEIEKKIYIKMITEPEIEWILGEIKKWTDKHINIISDSPC